MCERCIAKRSSTEEQCSRRRKEGSDYCGTHKNSVCSVNEKRMNVWLKKECKKRISVWCEEIEGIVYTLDNNGKVYDSENMCEENGKVIGSYVKLGEKYVIKMYEKE